ncbi:MAG: hypothetical protein H6Q04_598, partial [Acidobacteria bacterium]|nr:hypothetical protein [Acidobacteriota bacterium]
ESGQLELETSWGDSGLTRIIETHQIGGAMKYKMLAHSLAFLTISIGIS